MKWNWHKYKARPKEIDGIRFHSTKEANYYQSLKLARGNGLSFFLMQVPFHLPGGVKYVLDFIEFWDNGEIKFTDVKGHRTSEYKAKKKQVERLFGIVINET